MHDVQPEELFGAWTLLSYETRNENGEVGHPLGTDCTGILVYTPSGYMSVQIQASDRPQYGDGDLHGGSDQEAASAARGYLAYAGPYSLAGGGVIVHQMDVCIFPNWVADKQMRACQAEGDLLQLSSIEPRMIDGRQQTALLKWKRLDYPASATVSVRSTA